MERPAAKALPARNALRHKASLVPADRKYNEIHLLLARTY